MNKKVFPLRPKGEPAVPFIVLKNQDYEIVPLGYIGKSGEEIFDPLDLDRVKVTKKGELLDGTQIFMAEHSCNCGVQIKVFEKIKIIEEK